ncbi:MAG: acetyl-CoA carboxylase biotin carboxylase subunit [Candidatus Kariarchaeaceae archaeon]|jgi:acetyl/propionyl-CoA carboxylase alpha subunit
MYSSVLVANRGEIALRIITTLQDHGIETVVTASDADINSLPARRSDKVLHLHGVHAVDTYLSMDKIIDKASHMGVQAIHPGYGFLAENSIFSEKVEAAGIDFIGPSPKQMRVFGDKVEARKIAKNTGTPVIPGSDTNLQFEELREYANILGYPVLIKAAGGGGGRGIRFVNKKSELEKQVKIAQNEAKLAFGDDRLYLEKFIPKGRHVEVQILGLGNGEILHFGERDCSMQRKNQKLIEETPAPTLSREYASKIHETAIRLTSEINYRNAGTVEFLVEGENYYFLEVNARIQVEHPVTEMVTGEDLIWRQIQIAAGMDLDIEQKEITFKGHAIEARVYAENPYNNFTPSPGKINRIQHPIGSGVRIDSAMEDGCEVTPYYDSMISKVIVHSPNREAATRKMIATLENYLITGVHTTVPYIRKLLCEKDFSDYNYHTKYLDAYETEIPENVLNAARVAAAFHFDGSSNNEQKPSGEVSRWRTSTWPNA